MYKAFGRMLLFFALLFQFPVRAQQVVSINDHLPHHIFSFGEIEYLEDRADTIQFADVRSAAFVNKFKINTKYTPKNYNPGSAYWYRFKIRHSAASEKNWILELFDQSIHRVSLYIPDKGLT